MKFFRRMRAKTDKADAILNESIKAIDSTAKSAKKLENLLKANGVTLQILVATGGSKREK
jgi:hypothetical protein